MVYLCCLIVEADYNTCVMTKVLWFAVTLTPRKSAYTHCLFSSCWYECTSFIFYLLLLKRQWGLRNENRTCCCCRLMWCMYSFKLSALHFYSGQCFITGIFNPHPGNLWTCLKWIFSPASGKSEHTPEPHTLLFFLIGHRLVIFDEAWHYICSSRTQGCRICSHRYVVVNRKVTLLLLMSAPSNRLAAAPRPDKRGGWSHIGLFLTTAADNSISGSSAVTVLLDPCVTLSPKGNWTHLVSQQQLSDSGKYFSNWIWGFSKCLQMMPLMSALLEYFSIVGDVAKLHPFLFSVTLCCSTWRWDVFSFICTSLAVHVHRVWKKTVSDWHHVGVSISPSWRIQYILEYLIQGQKHYRQICNNMIYCKSKLNN